MNAAVTLVVEGTVDEAVVSSIVRSCGFERGTVYGRSGKDLIRRRIDGYNRAAQRSPWFVVVDLDEEKGCAPDLVLDWLPNRAPRMCLRVAVREIESWLMADADRFASFLGINSSLVPANPDAISDPKAFVVSLARRSRRAAIRNEMVPRQGSGRQEGAAYSSRLIEFVTAPINAWRPEAARRSSESLDSAIACLQRTMNLTV
jgi:hypothetical protein